MLSLFAFLAFAGILGSLPLLLFLAPGLRTVWILGVPLSVLLVAVPLFPLFVGLAWLYQRRADALDEAFRDAVRR